MCIKCINWCLLEVFDKRCVLFLGSCLRSVQKPWCEAEAPFHKRGFFWLILLKQYCKKCKQHALNDNKQALLSLVRWFIAVLQIRSGFLLYVFYTQYPSGFLERRMVLLFRIKHVKIAFPLSLNLYFCPIGRHTSKLARRSTVHSLLRFLKTCTSIFCWNEHARKETQSFSYVLGRVPNLWQKGLLNEEVLSFSTTLPEGSAQTGGSVQTRHCEECELQHGTRIYRKPLRCHMHVGVKTCHYCDPPQMAGTQ